MIETNLSNIISPYFDSGYPAIAVETSEEQRFIEDLKRVYSSKTSIFSIASFGGLFKHGEDGLRQVDATANFAKAFSHISQQKESFLLVMDYQHVVTSPTAYRPMLQALAMCKARGCMIIFLAPFWSLPPELRHEVPVLRIPLPSAEELNTSLDVVLESTGKKLDSAAKKELNEAARGLTLAQAENVFALSSLQKFSHDTVEMEKMRLIKSICMSVEKPVESYWLAGLQRLKDYISDEVLPSKDDDQLRVRGILLVGVPGTGKSLSAKVIASLLRWPLARLDISSAKAGLVGQSESNLRQALAMADAVAPCVLWIDEIEKAIGGFSSSAATDGGTTLSMVGTLLTWMQEHTSPVIVVATCNDYAKLPAELTRAGRFDEKFFLDLPLENEREAIAKVHLKRLGCDEKFADAIAEIAKEWTGAEIEQLIKSAARGTERKIELKSLEGAAREIIPISTTASIKDLREWAQRNLRRANDMEEAPKTGRRMTKNVQ